MNNEGEYYLGSTWKIGNPHYHMYICEGSRSRGKTTVWTNEVVQRAYKAYENGDTKRKFIYLRRSDIQLQLAVEKGLFNSVREVYPDFYSKHPQEKIWKGNIYISGEGQDGEQKMVHVGYAMNLNNVKGISIEDADVLLFDEYIEPSRSLYKGGDGGAREPELFARLCETIFRKREFWIIMLGNQDLPSNPYNEYFRIPYGSRKFKDKHRGIFYEFDEASFESKRKRVQSIMGKLFAGTQYDAYAKGEAAAVSLTNKGEFIGTKPNNAKQVCNIAIVGKKLTLWIDEENGVEYVTDKYKFNGMLPIMAVTRDDMSINSDFVTYNSQFLLIQKAYYGKGRIRFSDESVAELFYLMIKVV